MERSYSLVVILDPEDKKEEQEKLLEKIKKLISDLKGEKLREKLWGKRSLAYPIKKRKEGVYVEYEFILAPESAPELKRKLLMEEKILRYLLVKKEA